MEYVERTPMKKIVVIILLVLGWLGAGVPFGCVQPEPIGKSEDIIAVKKRVKFSEGILKEFPDLYRDLARLDAPGKFDLLQKITTYDHEKDKYKHQDKVTNKDIAGLIDEILRDGGKRLTFKQTNIICVICKGMTIDHIDYGPPVEKIRSGWHTPIPEVVPYIIKLLKDKNSAVRKSAVEILGQLRVKEAIPEIIKLLKDKNKFVRESAVDVLHHRRVKEAIPEIIKLLKDKDERVRRRALYALSSLGGKQAIPELVNLLKDESRYVRRSALEALGQLDAKEAIPEIMKLLKDEERGVRGTAAILLVELGAKDKVPKEVMEDIKSILKWPSDYPQRAAAALKKLGVSEEEIEKAK